MAGPIRIAITASGRQARAEIRGVATEADLLGKSFSRAGKLLAAGFAVDKVVRGVGALVETGGSYVETLNKVQAISKASQAQINAAGSTLEAQSSQYGKMGETAGDAADGLLELTKSGLSLKKSLQAVYPTMVLAKSGGLEVADASALVSNTLNTFSLKASKAADIANDLANAADISSADVSDLAESLKYVAPSAAKSHVSLAQTNALLAELSNSGVKASNAGTGLRKFLASLQAPTGLAGKAIDSLGISIYNAQGKMRPISSVIDQLRGSLGKLTEKQQNVDLRQIFGLTGITSAQVILKNGAAGLKTYTKGVTQAGGAARLANATSKGLYGELKALRAEAVTTADAFYRKYSPAVDDAIRADLPKALDAAKKAGAELLPTVKSLAGTAVDLGHDIADVAQGPIGQVFVGGLKLLVGLTKTASDALDSIPAPIRQIGIEAGIAALVMPRLAGGVTAATGAVSAQVARLKVLRAELITTQAVLRAPTTGAVPSTFTGLVIPPGNAVAAQKYASSLQLVEKSSLNVKAALSKVAPAAGIAGFVALTAGAKESNHYLSTLETTAGAAATGFAVGGPLGAAIVGTGGLIYSLATKFDNARTSAQQLSVQLDKANPAAAAQASYKSLIGTLDQVTGAYTGATRAAVLQKLEQSGVAAVATANGVSLRALVNAALGQGNAYATLNPILSAYRGNIDSLTARIDAATGAQSNYTTVTDKVGRSTTYMNQDALDYINKLKAQRNAQEAAADQVGGMSTALAEQAKKTRQAALVTQDLTGKLNGIPKKVQPAIIAQGIAATTRGVAKVAQQYHLLDKKKIQTLITASGATTTVAQVQKVIAKLQQAGHTKVDFSSFPKGVSSATQGAEQVASQGGSRVAKTLNQTTGKAKANLDPFQTSVQRGASAAVGPASAGGQSVGAALGNGVTAGFAPTQSRLVSQAVSAVLAAIGAARKAADAHSPSRKTAALGKDMGDGLVLGLKKTSGEVNAAAAGLTAGLLGALTDQSPIAANMQTISDYVSTQFDTTLNASTSSIDRKYAQVQRVLDTRYKAAEARIKKNLDGKAQSKALDKADKAHEALSNQIDRAKTKSEKAATAARNAAQAATLKATEAQRNQLAAVIQQQKDVKDQYDAATQSLTDLTQTSVDYASSVRDAVTATGSLSTLAQSGATSLTRLLTLRGKAVVQAKAFAADILQLTSAGLNLTDIQDLEAQGPAALKTADAIAKGGSDAIAQLNALQAQLQATGQGLGDSTAQTLYGAGITAAQGLVDGLAAQQGALAAVATTLGQQIAAGLAAGLAAASSQATTKAGNMADDVTKKVKHKFKVKSPSRVFQIIGGQVNQGLALGLGSTYATRAAGGLATDVTRSFGTPALDAYLASRTRSPAADGPGSGSGQRFQSLIGQVVQQQGESAGVLADRLNFLLNTRG